MSFETQINQRLQERQSNQLYRQRKYFEDAQQAKLNLLSEKKQVINFCSNDYLGLASHPKLSETLQQAAKQYGVGSGASHLVIGHHKEHHLLENELAEFLGVERALVFGSGYAANMGVLTTLLEKNDAVFHDKLNHASLLDGGLYSGARFQRYLHNNMESLEQKLQASDAENLLIVSDAVFSMDGDCADIKALNEISKQYQAWLMLDDAHGFGVLGKDGRGTVSEQGVNQKDIPVYMATFGKALGCSGAFVAGDESLIEYLIQFCRHYIYTTAMPPAMAACVRQALKLVQEENWRREHLKSLIVFFRKEAELLGLDLMPSTTAIQPLVLGSAEKALQWSQTLLENNLLVSAIRPPTVPQNTARLRITLSAGHQQSDVELLLEVLAQLKRGKKKGEGA